MAWSWKRARSILGMNARNLKYVRPYNSGRAVKLANNKLATKEKLLAAGLPTAKLHGVIRNRKELFQYDWSSLPSSIVLKPNFGLGGGGIIVLYGKDKQGRWISVNDTTYGVDELREHVSNILDGNYSMSNVPDVAYFEERLKLSDLFKNVAWQGVPDIRVLVFNSVPVMAMLRLPTKASAGKANLHIGGLGVGIDLVTGKTTYAVSKELGFIHEHPDFKTPLQGIAIPQWDNILKMSIEASRAIGLGFSGVDIVLDKQAGPMILEVNGHPGFEIQNANRLTLRDRLERVAGLSINSSSKGLKVCKELFGEQGPQPHDDAKILGVFEPVTLLSLDNNPSQLRALIDTALTSTTISRDLATRLGFAEAIAAVQSVHLPEMVTADRAEAAETEYRPAVTASHAAWVDVAAVRSGSGYILRPKLQLTFTIGEKTITTQVAVALDNKLSQPMVIGRRDLSGFLINPTRGIM